MAKKAKKTKPGLTAMLLISAGGLIIIGISVSLFAHSGANKFKEPARKALVRTAASSPGSMLSAGSGPADSVDTGDWETYSEGGAGFKFRYPPEVELGAPEPGSDAVALSVASRPVKELRPDISLFGYDKEEAREDRAALKEGEPGEEFPEMYAPSLAVKEIAGGDKNAKSFLVFSHDALCDVVFERNLMFYNNNNQIVITLAGPQKKIMGSSRHLFTADNKNCQPGQKVWSDGGQDKFYALLTQGLAPVDTQEWYDLFDEIVATVSLDARGEGPEGEEEGQNGSEEDRSEVRLNFSDISN